MRNMKTFQIKGMLDISRFNLKLISFGMKNVLLAPFECSLYQTSSVVNL